MIYNVTVVVVVVCSIDFEFEFDRNIYLIGLLFLDRWETQKKNVFTRKAVSILDFSNNKKQLIICKPINNWGI